MEYEGVRVKAGQLLRGYEQALHRLLRALNEENVEPTFFGLFEALNWAVALDDVIGETWRPAGEPEPFTWRSRVTGGELMDGVRYARNRVHHQWADALRLEHRDGGILPFGGHSWLWRPFHELPLPDDSRPDRRGQQAYHDMVDNDDRVAYTLSDLNDVFAQVMMFLEPRRAVPQHRVSED